MKHHLMPREQIWRTSFFLIIFASVLTLVANTRAVAQIIPDDRVEPIYVTPANQPPQNLQNETTWYRVTFNEQYWGYVKVTTRNLGATVEHSIIYDYKDPKYFSHMEDTIVYKQGSLQPLKQTLFFEGRGYKAYMKIEKEFYFDWNKKQIVIASGSGTNIHTRAIPMMDNALYLSASEGFLPQRMFFLRDLKLLKSGTKYEFLNFMPDNETYWSISATVLAETKDETYEIAYEKAKGFGEIIEMRFWLTPRTSTEPNGVLMRQEFAVPTMGVGPAVMKKVDTEEEAKDSNMSTSKEKK